MTAESTLRGARQIAQQRLREQGLGWFVSAAVQHLRARFRLRQATSLGSARLRGKARLENQGTTHIGDRVRLDGGIVPLDFFCARGASLSIGEGTFINFGSSIAALQSVSIGERCDIGQYAIILDNDFHSPEQHSAPGVSNPIVIEDDVWMGARVTVLPGTRIGHGAVIGAGAVVHGTIPPRTVAVGVPARVVRHLGGPDA